MTNIQTILDAFRSGGLTPHQRLRGLEAVVQAGQSMATQWVDPEGRGCKLVTFAAGVLDVTPTEFHQRYADGRFGNMYPVLRRVLGMALEDLRCIRNAWDNGTLSERQRMLEALTAERDRLKEEIGIQAACLRCTGRDSQVYDMAILVLAHASDSISVEVAVDA